jgi:hypothetical protein
MSHVTHILLDSVLTPVLLYWDTMYAWPKEWLPEPLLFLLQVPGSMRITLSTVAIPSAGAYPPAAWRTLRRTGLVYGILWLSEGICTSTWASPPVLAFHLPSLDHEPSGHLQQDSWTSYSHEGRTMRNPPPTCLIACNRDSYPLRKNQKPSLCGLIRASQTCGPAELRVRAGCFCRLSLLSGDQED